MKHVKDFSPLVMCRCWKNWNLHVAPLISRNANIRGDPLTYCSRGVTTKRTRGRKGGEVRAFSRNVEFTWHRCAHTVLHFALFKWPFLSFLLSLSLSLSLFFLIECYLVARAHNTDTRHRFRVRMSTSFRFRRVFR